MSGIPLTHYLLLAAALFGIGLFGALARRNAISVLMGVELMLNGVNLNLLAFSRCADTGGPTGPVFVVFVITIAAAEAAVALAILVSVARRMRTSNVDDLNALRG
jgi:NADH:ubiquinone oxidoreductase subunit K